MIVLFFLDYVDYEDSRVLYDDTKPNFVNYEENRVQYDDTKPNFVNYEENKVLYDNTNPNYEYVDYDHVSYETWTNKGPVSIDINERIEGSTHRSSIEKTADIKIVKIADSGSDNDDSGIAYSHKAKLGIRRTWNVKLRIL